MFRKTLILLPILATLAILSFELYTEPAKSCPRETTSGSTSHNFGTDCLSCHNKESSGGAIFFSTAGSVMDEARAGIYKKPIVKLYTKRKGGGKLVATLTGDESGNFYSTEGIDFSEGLYPTLVGTPTAAEPIKHMLKPAFSGNCNGCHGPTEEKLGID